MIAQRKISPTLLKAIPHDTTIEKFLLNQLEARQGKNDPSIATERKIIQAIIKSLYLSGDLS